MAQSTWLKIRTQQTGRPTRAELEDGREVLPGWPVVTVVVVVVVALMIASLSVTWTTASHSRACTFYVHFTFHTRAADIDFQTHFISSTVKCTCGKHDMNMEISKYRYAVNMHSEITKL